MKDFKIIYRILQALEAGMDEPFFDPEQLAPEALGCTKARRDMLLMLLAEKGLIAGAAVREYPTGRAVAIQNLRLTLDGLEYLEENSVMKRIHRAAKELSDLIP